MVTQYPPPPRSDNDLFQLAPANEQTDERTDERTNGRTDGRTDRPLKERKLLNCYYREKERKQRQVKTKK